ncbi:MAG: VTT domain-containing protein [Bacteroidota bacterium]
MQIRRASWLYSLSIGFSAILPLLLSGSIWLLGRPYLIQMTERGVWGLCLFTLLAASIMGMALSPTTLVALASGFLWGWAGFPAMLIAYLLAAMLGRFAGLFLSSQLFPRSWQSQTRVIRFIRRVEARPWQALIFARLSPALPFAMTNLVLGKMQIPLLTYVSATMIGMLPRSVVSFGIGVYATDIWGYLQGNVTRSSWELGLAVFLLIISILGLWRVFRTAPEGSTSE